MNRSAVALLAILAGLGSWYFFSHVPLGNMPQSGWKVPGAAVPDPSVTPAPPPGPGSTIRIATFNLGVYGPTKMSRPVTMEYLAKIIRTFDIVAVQEVRTRDDGAVPALVDQINRAGREYDYVISPRLGRTSQTEQFAFIFDRRTIEVDRHQLYTIYDPDDLLHREPFVGWFRARGPDPSAAFTFTLVNLHTDPDLVDRENALLQQIMNEVRGDGRNEDDVILLGDFNDSSQELDRYFLPHSGIVWALPHDTPTNTLGDQQYDNLVFSRQFTDEFTGRAGTLDILRQFNLTMDQARAISDHFPVWAEFRVYEGSQPGRLAQEPTLLR
ncbi:MAG: endonuclease/exonuclease/phosphatase family protein [Planctomycetales bacterium]|nr:endonuclease/exonuclease/phosphatase family protein [Planctomycetales bacterium]